MQPIPGFGIGENNWETEIQNPRIAITSCAVQSVNKQR